MTNKEICNLPGYVPMNAGDIIFDRRNNKVIGMHLDNRMEGKAVRDILRNIPGVIQGRQTAAKYSTNPKSGTLYGVPVNQIFSAYKDLELV